MAAITASMVAELRAKTDAPMMECKKALTEAEGDMAKAEEILRVKLGSKASKAASRVTAEGVVSSAVDGNVGALVEINCETDFVSKNDSFLAFAKSVAELIAKGTAATRLVYQDGGQHPYFRETAPSTQLFAEQAQPRPNMGIISRPEALAEIGRAHV